MSTDNKNQIIQLLQEIKNEFLLTFKREDVIDFVFKNTEQMIKNSELEEFGLFGLDNHPFGSNSNKNDAITIMSKMAILKEYLNKYLSLLLSISNNPTSFNEFQMLVNIVDINKLDDSIENESIPLKWKNKLSESLNFIKNRLGYNMSIKDINQDYYKSIFKFISKQLKLEFFYDTTDDHNLYTFSEHQFVLDIKFTKVGVNVDIIDHPNQELKKDIIENVLLKNIKMNDMEQFRNNLEFITKLNSKYLKNQNINLFHLIDVMNKDIDFLFNNENDGNCNRLFDFGHGIPLKFHNVIGPTIIFWTNSININKTEDVIELFKKGDKDINKQFIMGDLSIEESGMHSLVLPNTILKYIYLKEENIQLNEGNENIFNIIPHTYPLINQPIKMLYFNPNNTELAHQLSVPLKWYFNLKQPVLICQQLIIKISIIVGQLLTNEFLFLFDSQPIPDLCEVLINESIQKQEFIEPFNVNNNIDINSSPWIAKLNSHNKLQRYGLMSEHNICYNLLKIPINHPTQLLPVFNVIRHQLRFNTLIQSCFNEKTYQPELNSFDYEIEKKYVIRIWLLIEEVPNKITIVFQLPDSLITLKFNIFNNESYPFINLKWIEDTNFNYPNLIQNNLILENSLNIPLLCASIFHLIGIN